MNTCKYCEKIIEGVYGSSAHRPNAHIECMWKEEINEIKKAHKKAAKKIRVKK